MDVKVENNPMKKFKRKIGDMIQLEGICYIIANEHDGFILRNLSDWQGWNGHHSTIENLIISVSNRKYTYYSSEEYELVISKKIE